MNFNCNNNCCHFKTKEYINNLTHIYTSNKNKAGAFLYDKNKILLIQSRGNLWGPPKGTINPNETTQQCAVREVLEETGIDITSQCFDNFFKIKNTTYFYIKIKHSEVFIQNNTQDNDATGIAWVNISCLNSLILDKKIKITYHLKLILKSFNNI